MLRAEYCTVGTSTEYSHLVLTNFKTKSYKYSNCVAQRDAFLVFVWKCSVIVACMTEDKLQTWHSVVSHPSAYWTVCNIEKHYSSIECSFHFHYTVYSVVREEHVNWWCLQCMSFVTGSTAVCNECISHWSCCLCWIDHCCSQRGYLLTEPLFDAYRLNILYLLREMYNIKVYIPLNRPCTVYLSCLGMRPHVQKCSDYIFVFT